LEERATWDRDRITWGGWDKGGGTVLVGWSVQECRVRKRVILAGNMVRNGAKVQVVTESTSMLQVVLKTSRACLKEEPWDSMPVFIRTSRSVKLGTSRSVKPGASRSVKAGASRSVKLGNVINVESSEHKTSKDKSKTYRPDAPIIEDWISDSEDETEIESVPKQREPTFVKSTKHVKTSRESVKKVEHNKQ
nr:hypothetical protein [Tanacetum cinerariifolium]